MSQIIDAAPIFQLRRDTAAQQRDSEAARTAELRWRLDRIDGLLEQLMDEQRDRLDAERGRNTSSGAA